MRLRAFAAVARQGTYTAAARSLHVAQPALWKQVETLERELGVRLFERHGRRVVPTPAARQLLERCEALVQGADDVVALAGELRAGRTGLVTVSCSPPHITRFLATVVGELRATHPGILVQLRESTAGDPRVELAAGAADLAVGVGPSDTDDALLLYRVFTVVVPPPGHPLSRRAQVEVDALRDQPLLTAPSGFRSRAGLEAACRAAGFDPLVEYESPSPPALLALAQAGVGLAVMSDDALPPHAGPRVLLRAGGPPLADDVRMYRRPASQIDPAVAVFLAQVRIAAGRERS